ncbi:MAG TPA: uracil-DNA glycosylase, partial [Actinomycetota bacterium]|nr:uracil-DNA glycosylase [Actinomycetota bacterium]
SMPVRWGVSVVWQTLEHAKAEASGCTRCRLSGSRTQVVWMDGNPESDLMFVGEAPGFHEDRLGKPFVGAAGKLLDGLLEYIGLDRSGCVICNVIKCRPPANRNPEPDEIASCTPYLRAQIEFIKPTVIVTLGNFATRFLLERQLSITRVRGQIFRTFGAKVIPTLHPAAALHSGGVGSPQYALIRSDFDLVKRELATARPVPAPAPAPAAAGPVAPAPDAGPLVEQGSLF